MFAFWTKLVETNQYKSTLNNMKAITKPHCKYTCKCIQNFEWRVRVWLHKTKYLLTSYVSTKAMNPSGKAIANDTIAANSPSLDSSGETPNNTDNCRR